MKRNRICGAIVVGTVFLFVAYWQTSFRPGPPASLKALSDVDPNAVARAANQLRGILYDPLQGRYGNIGGRIGFIVCIDVPVLSYQEAGCSIKQLLKSDFNSHPDAYDTKSGNTPDNPFFHRRARNLYSYCLANNCLLPMTSQPQVSDVVFYKKPQHSHITHIALVTRVDGSGNYWLVEAAPETVLAQEQASTAITSRGWQPQGIGRLIPHATVQ